jgi:hypothetical protein
MCILLMRRSHMLNTNEFHILLYLLCSQCSLLRIIYKIRSVVIAGKLRYFLLHKTWDQNISSEIGDWLFTQLWWHRCLAGSGL